MDDRLIRDRVCHLAGGGLALRYAAVSVAGARTGICVSGQKLSGDTGPDLVDCGDDSSRLHSCGRFRHSARHGHRHLAVARTARLPADGRNPEYSENRIGTAVYRLVRVRRDTEGCGRVPDRFLSDRD